MIGMFNMAHNPSLRSADVRGLDVSDVESFCWLFMGDSQLTKVEGMDNWNVSNRLTNVGNMFYGCNISSLDLSRWDMSNVTYFDGCFWGLGSKLRFLKLPANVRNIPTTAFTTDVNAGPSDASWSNVPYYVEDTPGNTSASPFYPYNTGIVATSFSVWRGRPYAVSFNANGGAGTADTLKGGWPDNPGVTLASGAGFTRAGYRLVGWSKTANATSPDYALGSSYTPTDDVTLYGVWLPTPTVSNDLLFPWMNGGEAGKVKVSGAVPQGGGVRAVQSGDKIEVALMPKGDPGSTNPSVGTPAAANDVTLDTASCSATACNWSATFPISTLSDADDVGQGMSYVFRARLVTASDSNSDYAFSAGKRADLVAPAVTGATFNKRARTVSGSVWSSGDASKQPNRAKETKFSVTVAWPAGSSPATTTLTCDSGTASIVGATCPSAGSGDGTFTLQVPSGVKLKGDSHMTAKDAPSADEPTLVGGGEPNVSTAVTFDTTMPMVASLPMTGGEAPAVWWRRILLPALLAGTVAVVFGARRRRLTMRR
ncbi:InlB B-repeat-containing protein [Bifidobacterium sp. ESL0763]|uniref:InlB B-repeat-containing protein n=1 Tax=Bifidobacterium sp. ESL0763 TaxID=2983227 RepID=UPI0035A925BF